MHLHLGASRCAKPFNRDDILTLEKRSLDFHVFGPLPERKASAHTFQRLRMYDLSCVWCVEIVAKNLLTWVHYVDPISGPSSGFLARGWFYQRGSAKEVVYIVDEYVDVDDTLNTLLWESLWNFSFFVY